jgi:DNA-binding MarR family transcriptional regulator
MGIKMEKSELVNHIIEGQRVLNRFLGQYEPDVWMDLNLTIAQVKCLFFISNHNDVNFRILAKALKVTPSNVTGIIDRLSEQDLVLREDNPQDRRMLMLKLTSKGEKLISNLRERRVSQMLTVLNSLPESELKIILDGFALIAKAVKNHSEITQI